MVKRHAKRAFTLIEILIVVVILGILAAIVIPQFTSASQDAQNSSVQSQLQTVRGQIELYSIQNPSGAYPTFPAGAGGWDDMTGASDAPVGWDNRPRFLQSAPRNAMRNNATGVLSGTAVPGDASGDGLTNNNGWYWNTAENILYAIDRQGFVSNFDREEDEEE
jgi:type II secretion system protein G